MAKQLHTQCNNIYDVQTKEEFLIELFFCYACCYLLPVHHIFCLTCDFLMSLRYGNVLCLNQDLESYKRILECSVRYTAFEKTSSKKIIRGKYFEQRKKQKEDAVHFKKAETETQQAIFNSVAECLGHQKFGIDMDLYEVGLDSLGSILLLTSLYEKVGLSITLQEFRNIQTITSSY